MGELTNFSNGVAYPDGSASLTLHLDGDAELVELKLTPDGAGQLIATVCALIREAHELRLDAPPAPGEDAYGPLQLEGIGLRPSSSPGLVGLLLQLPGIALVVEMPHSALARTAKAMLAMAASGSPPL